MDKQEEEEADEEEKVEEVTPSKQSDGQADGAQPAATDRGNKDVCYYST
jgi:hypothetical protein